MSAARQLRKEKQIPQQPGCLPKGYTLDSLLTVEQFAKWRWMKVRTARAKMCITPGRVESSQRDVLIHPRTFLEKSLK